MGVIDRSEALCSNMVDAEQEMLRQAGRAAMYNALNHHLQFQKNSGGEYLIADGDHVKKALTNAFRDTCAWMVRQGAYTLEEMDEPMPKDPEDRTLREGMYVCFQAGMQEALHGVEKQFGDLSTVPKP